MPCPLKIATESLISVTKPFLEGGGGYSGSVGAEGATIGEGGLRTGSPDFERRRKLSEERRGGWDSLTLVFSGTGGREELVGGEDDFGVGGRLCKVDEGEDVLEVPILDDSVNSC